MNGYINFDENGYENLSKEFKRELKIVKFLPPTL